jgi:hypothetical protein
MANPNPYKARKARKSRKIGDIEMLRRKLWSAVERCEQLVNSDDCAVALRGIHALAQVSGPFLKSVEVGEMRAELDDLRQKVAALEEQK